ncbi:GNAT family N-acetyltransferase [Streptomyces carpinensis]|nr:GNAT family N-acetyltransferase [Streptomyces carpinensis]
MSAASAPAFARWPVSLTTERLLLRPVEPADLPAHRRLWTDPEVRRHLGGPLRAEAVGMRERGCVGLPGLLSVVGRRQQAVLGSVFVEPGARDGRTEVSYQLLPEHWGRGHAREALAAVLARVPAGVPGTEPVAVTQEANARSRRLLEALGAEPAEWFVEWGEPQVLYRLGPRS